MRVVKLNDYERKLEKRKVALGLSGTFYVQPNAGTNRTPEKRSLLQAISKSAKSKGRKPRFQANF